MGSFNLACVATNMTIQEGDRCVAFVVEPITTPDGRAKFHDSIASPFHLSSYPARGFYNDYGRVEPDTEGAFGDVETNDRIMIFHEWAYEAMLTAVHAETARHKAWEDAYYADNGVPQYKIDREKRVEAALQAMEAGEENFDELKKTIPEDEEALKAWFEEHKEQIFAGIGHEQLIHAPEGESLHATFWNDKIAASDNPRKEYAKYKELIDPIFSARYMFHFQFHPSRYAGQEFELKGLLTLHAAMGNYLLEQQKRWHEDEDF